MKSCDGEGSYLCPWLGELDDSAGRSLVGCSSSVLRKNDPHGRHVLEYLLLNSRPGLVTGGVSAARSFRVDEGDGEVCVALLLEQISTNVLEQKCSDGRLHLRLLHQLEVLLAQRVEEQVSRLVDHVSGAQFELFLELAHDLT